jgi:plasmid maintenance system antidote protein VapI
MNNTQYYQSNNKREIKFIHPGIILSRKILKGKKITQKKLATETNISYQAVKDICQGKKDISKEVGQKLASYFRVHKDF